MVKARDFPEEGELVVGTVREVQGFGAFVTLEEYPGKEGFIHIAEVSSGWVKRIRDYVREKQRVVCKVLSVESRKAQVDLSLKRVNEHQRRDKIQEWKNEQKAENLFKLVAERMKVEEKEAYEKFGFELMETFGTLYGAFEEAAYDVETLKEEGLEGPWLDAFAEVAQENIQIPFVDIAGFLEMRAFATDGVESVKKALIDARKGEYEDVEIKITYDGAPHYRVNVRAPDYKIAEDQLKKAADRAIAAIEKDGGEGVFHREYKEE